MPKNKKPLDERIAGLRRLQETPSARARPRRGGGATTPQSPTAQTGPCSAPAAALRRVTEKNSHSLSASSTKLVPAAVEDQGHGRPPARPLRSAPVVSPDDDPAKYVQWRKLDIGMKVARAATYGLTVRTLGRVYDFSQVSGHEAAGQLVDELENDIVGSGRFFGVVQDDEHGLVRGAVTGTAQ
ncbi:hypothetical protein J2S43_000947 [Catenuloplanes nepalensis]|uniref:Uncharacterized protein n=1 Tax=Catenuloplanes nepalensis TaxID=587533 RepID=A0ABT9MLY0_9ACTN|nr:hypothetical protein [Catenuloplanes nepalensis]MDP9792435.1 hypothetical protein [Catenuloplanes nepalensis]